jgi:broad specificity phosphatase PhoE
VQLYFARHGESEANVQRIFWDQPHGYGLTEKGRGQARALAESLADVEIAALYCSPILRAAQTAQIVGRRLGLMPEIEDALRERDVGILEGQKIGPENLSLCWQVTQQWMVHGNHDARIEGGESHTDIAARFMSFIRRLEELYRDTDANVLLISHGITLATMLPGLLSNVDWAFVTSRPPFDGSFYVIAELRDGEWVCLRWGEDVLQDGQG